MVCTASGRCGASVTTRSGCSRSLSRRYLHNEARSLLKRANSCSLAARVSLTIGSSHMLFTVPRVLGACKSPAARSRISDIASRLHAVLWRWRYEYNSTTRGNPYHEPWQPPCATRRWMHSRLSQLLSEVTARGAPLLPSHAEAGRLEPRAASVEPAPSRQLRLLLGRTSETNTS